MGTGTHRHACTLYENILARRTRPLVACSSYLLLGVVGCAGASPDEGTDEDGARFGRTAFALTEGVIGDVSDPQPSRPPPCNECVNLDLVAVAHDPDDGKVILVLPGALEPIEILVWTTTVRFEMLEMPFTPMGDGATTDAAWRFDLTDKLRSQFSGEVLSGMRVVGLGPPYGNGVSESPAQPDSLSLAPGRTKDRRPLIQSVVDVRALDIVP